MDWFYGKLLGFNGTLALGLLSWGVLFAACVFSRAPRLIIPIQMFHGLAYVFFIKEFYT